MSEDTLNSGIDELENAAKSASNPSQTAQDVATSTTSNSAIPDILTKESPKKDIDPHYIQHPLNFRNSNGLGRMIRGLEGALGSLNYWPLDVTIGLLEEVWEMVEEKPETSSQTSKDY